MPDEELDNIIRNASDHHHPEYDDKAWDKMKQKLDKHLPQEKDRRNIVVYLLLLFLLIGGITFLLFAPKKQGLNSKYQNAVTKDQILNSKTQIPNSKIQLPGSRPENTNTGIQNHSVRNLDSSFQIAGVAKQIAGPSINNNDGKQVEATTNGKDVNAKFLHKKGKLTSTIQAPVVSDDIEDGAGVPLQGNEQVEKTGKSNEQTVIENNPSTKTKNDTVQIVIDPKEKSNVEKENKTAIKEPSKDKTKNKKFKNNFGITVSAGPDKSFVEIRDPGKTILYYGAGLSYDINRFNIRSGFYSTKKIYSAGPYEYHPPSGYWTYNADLKKVDGDCKVYEIPLTLSYKFKHNWFAAVGISSFLMKRETYHYLYKNQNGVMVYRGWTLRNKNKHYFSVLSLSGGYEFKINRIFSVAAEPYLKLPLAGVGFGKIKLNSGGILFTATAKPFAANRK